MNLKKKMQYHQYVARPTKSLAASETKKQDAVDGLLALKKGNQKDRANKLHKTMLNNAKRMRARAAQHNYPEPDEPDESEESEGDVNHLRRKLKNGTLNE